MGNKYAWHDIRNNPYDMPYDYDGERDILYAIENVDCPNPHTDTVEVETGLSGEKGKIIGNWCVWVNCDECDRYAQLERTIRYEVNGSSKQDVYSGAVAWKEIEPFGQDYQPARANGGAE